ncbi:sulfite exporter TauE/SafE family protein [uncultured Enterovirga sp.]|uniref:sulfite exporter TauE/SafE family protein n=1 Tax=uncultured Enterovirga sp. TaxID=2026352 RepID=UPI0035CC0E4A
MLIAGLSLKLLAVLWAGAFVGALAAGGAGFAFALAASSIWLHALDPLRTTMLVVTCGTVLHFALVWPMRRTIEGPRLAPFAIGGLLGIPVGVWVLTVADVGGVKTALGLFLILYGSYALLAPRLPVISVGGRGADAAIGFVGGVLGGIGGFSGVIPTIWTQLRGWTKERARGVYQPFILMAHLATFLVLGAVSLDGAGLVMVLAVLPPLAAGTWIGWRIYGRLDDRAFRRWLAVLLLLSGATLVI